MIRTLSFIALATLGMALTAQAQSPSETQTTALSSPVGAYPRGPLQPGDIVRLKIWREVELSGDFVIQPDGTAVLPRLGPYPATGKPAEEVQRDLVEQYSRTLLDPAVEVVFLRRITITGEVRAPGMYPIEPTMRLTDALTLAGGPLPQAKENTVVLIRGGERVEFDLQEALALRDVALESGDQLYVPKRNWFVRNWQLYTSILGTVMSVSAFILARNK